VGRGNPVFAALIFTLILQLLTKQLGLLRRKKHAPRNNGNRKSNVIHILKAFYP
jgi:hypothetical protein